jgi:hypothetical protein
MLKSKWKLNELMAYNSSMSGFRESFENRGIHARQRRVQAGGLGGHVGITVIVSQGSDEKRREVAGQYCETRVMHELNCLACMS